MPADGTSRPPHSDPDPTLEADDMLSALVETWKGAATSASFGGSTLVFADPQLVVATLLTHVGAPPRGSPAHSMDLENAAVRPEGTSPSLVVLQLWALRDLASAFLATAADRHQPVMVAHGAIGGALAPLVTDALLDLERASLLDPLTGLLNRRALDRDLRQSLAAARRHRQCLSLVMIDVDGLKATNDRYGHAAGDETLCTVAGNLASSIRAGDNAYRLGGDEFVLLLPDLCPEDVSAVMERTPATAQSAYTWGCAWVGPDDDDPIDDNDRAPHLLALADQRMINHRRTTRASAATLPVGTDETSDHGTAIAEQYVAGHRAERGIDEAIGIVAERLYLETETARTLLQDLAASHHASLPDVARRIIEGDIDSQGLLAAGRSESNRAAPAGR